VWARTRSVGVASAGRRAGAIVGQCSRARTAAAGPPLPELRCPFLRSAQVPLLLTTHCSPCARVTNVSLMRPPPLHLMQAMTSSARLAPAGRPRSAAGARSRARVHDRGKADGAHGHGGHKRGRKYCHGMSSRLALCLNARAHAERNVISQTLLSTTSSFWAAMAKQQASRTNDSHESRLTLTGVCLI